MQPHDMEPRRPDPGNDNDPKNRGQTTFWLLMVIIGLLAAISVNLLGRL